MWKLNVNVCLCTFFHDCIFQKQLHTCAFCTGIEWLVLLQNPFSAGSFLTSVYLDQKEATIVIQELPLLCVNSSWDTLLQTVARMYTAKKNHHCWQEGSSLPWWLRRAEQRVLLLSGLWEGPLWTSCWYGAWLGVCVRGADLTPTALCTGVFHLFSCPTPFPMCTYTRSRVL